MTDWLNEECFEHATELYIGLWSTPTLSACTNEECLDGDGERELKFVHEREHVRLSREY